MGYAGVPAQAVPLLPYKYHKALKLPQLRSDAYYFVFFNGQTEYYPSRDWLNYYHWYYNNYVLNNNYNYYTTYEPLSYTPAAQG